LRWPNYLKQIQFIKVGFKGGVHDQNSRKSVKQLTIFKMSSNYVLNSSSLTFCLGEMNIFVLLQLVTKFFISDLSFLLDFPILWCTLYTCFIFIENFPFMLIRIFFGYTKLLVNSGTSFMSFLLNLHARRCLSNFDAILWLWTPLRTTNRHSFIFLFIYRVVPMKLETLLS